MTDPPRMISVFRDGRGCIGFVLDSCRGYLAFNADGQPVPGNFHSKEAAVEAITASTPACG